MRKGRLLDSSIIVLLVLLMVAALATLALSDEESDEAGSQGQPFRAIWKAIDELWKAIDDLRGEIARDSCRLNVKSYGAMGDGITDDTAAIQSTINAAAQFNFPVVCVPPGRYLITSIVHIGVDNLKIVGSPGAVIVVDVAMPSAGFIPLLAHKGYPQNPPDLTYNLGIEGITVEYLRAGQSHAGAIQLNHCVDFYVEDVRIIGDGEGMNGSMSNGISCAYSESTGVFKNVVVIGVSKPGFYASDGHDIRFEGCIARDCYSTVFTSGNTGFGIGNVANVILADCQSYNNNGPGVQITNLGTPVPDPYSNIQIIGGQFHHNNTHGIVTGTHLIGTQGSSLQIIGADCSDNEAWGIWIMSASNVLIADCITARNNGGIIITDILPGQGAEDQTNLVTVRGCQIYNNEIQGMILRAANNVTVENCRIYHSVDGKQATGLGIWHYGTPPDQKKNTNLRIVDVDLLPMTATETPIEHPGGIDSAVETGYYRLQNFTLGAPNGKVYAPPGSEYTDLQTGIKYQKASGFDQHGWVKLIP